MRYYLAALAATALIVLVTVMVGAFQWPRLVGFAVASFLILGAWLPLRFQHRGGNQAFAVDEAVFVGLLFVADPWAIPALMAVAVMIGHLLHGLQPQKVAFNASSVAIAATGGASIAAAAGMPVGVFSLSGAVIAVGAALVYNAIGAALLAGLFWQLEATPPRAFLSTSMNLNLLTLFGNLVLGLSIGVVATTVPPALILILLLGVGVQLGYRGYAIAVLERRRAQDLLGLTQTLSEFPAEPDALGRFLAELAASHGARGAAIRLTGPEGEDETQVWGDVTGIDTALARAVAVGRPVRLDERTDGIDALAVPLVHNAETIGTLAVARHEGVEPWNDDSLMIFGAVAAEVVVAVRSLELFQQVQRERSRWAEESRKLHDILTAASDGIAMVASDGTLVSWNPGMTALSGVDAEHATGRPWWTVLRVRDVDGEDLLPEGRHVVSGALAGERHAEPISLQVLRRDGQWRWLRATFSPLLSEDGSVAGTVVVARDVTAETEAEGLKADFVATVSHELRTPLTPLKGFLATLRQRGSELTAEQTQLMYSSMESQVGRLERLVADLLVVADLERGRVILGHELVDLRRAVEMAIDDEADGYEDRISITGEPELTAAADGGAVVRIVRALVSNALKHTDGAVVVELGRAGRTPVIRVRDEGPGIPPWEQDRIFRRFHRLGDHLLRTQGPGLGLSIARALADRLGGAIEIDSDLGHGATFTLSLRPASPMPLPRSRSLSDAG